MTVKKADRFGCAPFAASSCGNSTAPGIALDVQEKLAAGIDIIGPECAMPLDARWINLRSIAEEAKRQSNCHLDS